MPGTQNIDPAIGVSICEVEFLGRDTNELEANIIAESMLSEIDWEGKYYCIMNEIVDYERNSRVIWKKDGFILSKMETNMQKEPQQNGIYK